MEEITVVINKSQKEDPIETRETEAGKLAGEVIEKISAVKSLTQYKFEKQYEPI